MTESEQQPPHADLDFEAEGLFDDVEGEEARAARARLVNYLIDEENVSLDEIKQAQEERRLFLLGVERALGGDPKYTAEEVAELADFDLDLFLELRGSLGLVEPPRDLKFYSDADVKTMRAVRMNLAMGMSEESVREINRVLGGVLAQLAVSVERQFLATYLDPELDEAEMARRAAAITRATTPEFAFVLQHLFNLHMRDSLRADILGNEAALDLISDKREMTVCFADLVGFTALGEQIPAEELGSIAERLSSLASELVAPPVRLVKSIGDAVMLVSTEPRALIDTALALSAAVEAEGEGFPRLSVGIAFGEAADRSGDVFGPPVNLASRLTDMARPGAVITTGEMHERFHDDYDWTSIGRRRIKGLPNQVPVYRVRRLGDRAKSKRRDDD